MLYTNDRSLPDFLRDDNGLNLCKVWFLTYFGVPIHDAIEDFEKLSKEKLDIQEISAYKVPFPNGELIKMNGKWHVGDGFGNAIYAPCRDTDGANGYSDVQDRIEAKYSVTKKVI